MRLRADEHPVQRRSRLEPRCGVDDVPGHHRLSLARPSVQRDERFAGVHRDAHLELVALLRRPVTDRERRSNRPLRIVLVRHGGAEHGHDGVADELLDHASEPFELCPKAAMVAGKERADVLRIQALGSRGEADQIGEDDGNHLPLLAREAGRLARERSSAKRTEGKRLRQLLAAARAGRHLSSLDLDLARPAGSREGNLACAGRYWSHAGR